LLSEFQDKVVYVHCDVGNEEQVQDVVGQTINRFGRIDALVNNAVMFASGTLANVDSASWRRSMGTNINSVFYFCSLVIPHMQSAGGGSIVNIGSIVGSLGQYGTVPYGTA
jgi:meso-butanediol dehydrogenase/(S,S)-butanediol dehydrogenase/diacetyl reductase